MDSEGNMDGDDIIVFAQDRFFTLRQGIGLDLTVKEQIPIEAAIAYIEAKHTITLEGQGPASLYTACKQVAKVKALCAKRDSVKLGTWNPYIESPIDYPAPIGFAINNPMYGVIFTRYVKRTSSSRDNLSSSDIDLAFKEIMPDIVTDRTVAPDLIILGDSNVATPAISEGGESSFSLFMSQISSYGTKIVPDISYGIGFVCLQFALDWIRLGKLPFDKILSNALGIKRVEGGPGSPVKGNR